MSNYKYLIIGGGMTGDAAVRGIRMVDPNGSIGMIGDELHPPYNRPPLSKGLWKGKRLETIWRKDAEQEAILHLGHRVKTLDLAGRRVVDDDGTVYTFQKLLLATGGTPRRLPVAANYILYYRTLDDYHRLRALTERGERFAVIGGGFIGAELAAALAISGKQAIMIFPEAAIGSRLFPAELATHLNQYYREKGVEILDGDYLAEMAVREHGLALKTGHGREILVDGVVAGVGIQPNVELARAAGLKVADGICVDPSLATSHPDVYAAGDVAEFYNPALDRRLRVEHEDAANSMGIAAGRAMAGESIHYDHLPFFYSDLFDLGYEAIGEIDSRYATVADWKDPHRKGVIYYLNEGRVRGVLLWNVWEQVDAARQLIAAGQTVTAEELRGRIAIG
jgi:NADPH-dependent 2,4-dienoyl-CoA reductase/sulfur reductase-like enzyme